MPLSILEKIWQAHQVVERSDKQWLLYVDRHLIHEGSVAAFKMLKDRGLQVRTPNRVFATPDHYVPTDSRDASLIGDQARKRMIDALSENTRHAGITLFDLEDPRHGIVHVVGPEQGISQPGMLIVCGDSHTSTHGALGALAFGIGATEVSHVLATQTLWQRKPSTMRITVEGQLGKGVTAKDIMLAIIAKVGVDGAAGHAIEYAGNTITSLSMEGRLTICNMTIEAGARAGIIAPDEVTFAYLHGRPFSPSGAAWSRAIERWGDLRSDPDARFDREVLVSAESVEPMVTWGTNPQQALSISGYIPHPTAVNEKSEQESIHRALDYMGLTPGMALVDIPIQRVFIGSCTNSRIEDLRDAAMVARAHRVKPNVEAWVVPGSGLVKAQAEREGLDKIFKDAGFQWRNAGCSMCLGTNGEIVAPGERCASTSNRNFVGRQGIGARTHLMSPASAAAAAVTGRLADVREIIG